MTSSTNNNIVRDVLMMAVVFLVMMSLIGSSNATIIHLPRDTRFCLHEHLRFVSSRTQQYSQIIAPFNDIVGDDDYDNFCKYILKQYILQIVRILLSKFQ